MQSSSMAKPHTRSASCQLIGVTNQPKTAMAVAQARDCRDHQASAETRGAVAATVLFPYTPLGAFFNFQPLTAEFLLMIGIVLLLYIFSAELAKKRFYRRARY